VPLRTTSLPCVSTVMRLASSSGAPPECFLDLLLDLLCRRFEPWLEADQVADPLHSFDPAHRRSAESR